jgi:outer membrane protein insertion porin family
MKKIFAFYLFLLFCFAVGGWRLEVSPAEAQAFKTLPKVKGTAQLSPLITGIEIKGNIITPEKEIMDVIFSRVGDSLVQEKINSDQKAVYGLGYFSDVSVTFEAQAGGTKVIFLVVENPQVKEIIFQGNTVYSSAELRSLISVKVGSLLNFKNLQTDIDKVNTKYKTAGYMLARVTDVDTDPKTGILRFKIIEGQVEAITLDGNDATQDYVILRELDTKPGGVINEKTLKNDLRRVFNLGFFSEVTPDFQPGTSPDKIVIVLKTKETRTSTINFGGGYGEREGWFGFLDLSINNLMGTAQGLMIRGQTGQELSTYQFKYSNPWLFPDKLGKRAAFSFRRWLTIGRDIYQVDEDAVYNGFDLSLGRPWLGDFSTAWTLGSEVVSPHGQSSFEAYQSDTVGFTVSYDTRDFWLNPKEGSYHSLALKQGWKHQPGSTGGFFKISPDFNRFTPVLENQVLAAHLGLGIGFGDVPSGEQYWAGGANSVRGYYPSEVKKGNRKLIANVEYRLNFNEMFQGVFFYDWGNAWNSGPPDFANFISGWGPGVRVNTPLGPIRLDWGVPSSKTFSEGVMHFSIGQAF